MYLAFAYFWPHIDDKLLLLLPCLWPAAPKNATSPKEENRSGAPAQAQDYAKIHSLQHIARCTCDAHAMHMRCACNVRMTAGLASTPRQKSVGMPLPESRNNLNAIQEKTPECLTSLQIDIRIALSIGREVVAVSAVSAVSTTTFSSALRFFFALQTRLSPWVG